VLIVKVEACGNPLCHGTKVVQNIRKEPRDLDGDASKSEGLTGEVDTFGDILLGAMMDYARGVAGAPITYDSHSYPYFFSDDNNHGLVDDGEGSYSNWTPRLLLAAYNYQCFQKDPGAFAHYGKYILQVLYDSIRDLSAVVPVGMSAMIRP